VKWLLTELAVIAITVLVIVPLLVVVMVACLPFSAIWSLCGDDDDGGEEQ
jgi:hypothetical protein